MLAFLAAALIAAPASAWDQHRRVTEAALASIPGLDAPVRAETLGAFLAASGWAPSEKDFVAALKLNRAANFPFSAGESEGSAVSLRAVIARYSDEPDWGMDQDVFDQYPELWREEYRYMCLRTGPQSRVFRHMYWPGGFYRPGATQSVLPVHDPTPLGVAPERAELFLAKSRAAFAAGRPYWGGRFLGWALHYLEDLTQPYHATQLPSAAFLRFTPDGRVDVELSARVVAYYHLAFDAFPAKAAEGVLGPDLGPRLTAALGGSDAVTPFPGAAPLCRSAAEASADRAERSGARSLSLFPKPTSADLADPAGRVQHPSFWADLAQDASARPEIHEMFAAHLSAALKAAGPPIRALVAEALTARPPAPVARRRHPRLEEYLQTARDRWLPLLQGQRPFSW